MSQKLSFKPSDIEKVYKDQAKRYSGFANDSFSWLYLEKPWGTTSPLFLRPVADIVNETIKAGFTIKSLEEPSVPLAAKKADHVNYLKYSFCPSRIAVIATK